MKERSLKTFSDLLRINQWVKNTFVFFPLIFSAQFFVLDKILNSIIAFLAFCLISSGTYIVNDWRDIDVDRLHPRKSRRPLTNKRLSLKSAFFISAICFLSGIFLAFKVNFPTGIMACLYVVLHWAYNFYLKKIVLLDVIAIAIGYTLRIWGGSLAIGIIPSIWLQICVFLVTLFLALTKRKAEIFGLERDAINHRSVLAHYDMVVLNQLITISAALTVISYGLYVFFSDLTMRVGINVSIGSLIFVLFGIYRYLSICEKKAEKEDPTIIILSDIPLLINILLWMGYIFFVIYFFPGRGLH